MSAPPRYVGLMTLPQIAGLYPSREDEQGARDLAAVTFGIGADVCFSEVHPGDPWWMLLASLLRPRLVRVWRL